MYLFIGRYSKTSFVDVIAFNDQEKATEFYKKEFSEMLENKSGYNEIELLEQTATHYYNIIQNDAI